MKREGMVEDFQLGEWHVSPRELTLSNTSSEIKIKPKAMDILLAFKVSNKNILSREEIYDFIWPDQVVSNASLNAHIADLRKVLGDNASNPTYLKTRSKLGYELLVPIQPISKNEIIESSDNQAEEENKINDSATSKTKKKHFYFIAITLLSIALLASLASPSLFKSSSYQNYSLEELKSKKEFEYLVEIDEKTEWSEESPDGFSYCVDNNHNINTIIRYSETNNSWEFVSDYGNFLIAKPAKKYNNLIRKVNITIPHISGTLEQESEFNFKNFEHFYGYSKWTLRSKEGKKVCNGISYFSANVIN